MRTSWYLLEAEKLTEGPLLARWHFAMVASLVTLAATVSAIVVCGWCTRPADESAQMRPVIETEQRTTGISGGSTKPNEYEPVEAWPRDAREGI